MTYVLIIFVVVLALAPLWHFRPSPGQRKQASLREAAALAGLFVEFRDLPLPTAQLQRLPAADRQVLYYGCRVPASRRAVRPRQSWYRVGEDWRGAPARVEAPELVHALPASVLAIGVSESSCGVYWREDGDEETVRELAAKLLNWRAELGAA